MGKAEYTSEKVKEMMAEMDAIPPKTKILSTFAMIQEISAQILGMVEKGYGYEEIAQYLTENEIPIKVNTLKNYLMKAKAKKKKPDEGH